MTSNVPSLPQREHQRGVDKHVTLYIFLVFKEIKYLSMLVFLLLTLKYTIKYYLSLNSMELRMSERLEQMFGDDLSDLCASPEQADVNWSNIERRIESSINALGIHEVREHYFAGVFAYEDEVGGCPAEVCRDIISPMVNKLIERRF